MKRFIFIVVLIAASAGVRGVPNHIAAVDSFLNLARGKAEIGKRFEWANRALAVSNKAGNNYELARSHMRLGDLFHAVSDYPSAIKSYLAALEEAEQFGYSELQVDAANSLAGVYIYLQDYTHCKEMLEKALAVIERSKDSSSLSPVLSLMAVVSQNLGDSLAANRYVRKSLDVAKSIGDNNQIFAAYSNLAGWYEDVGNWEPALQNEREAIRYALITSSKSGLAISLTCFGKFVYNAGNEVLSRQGIPPAHRFDTAEAYLRAGESAARESGHLSSLRFALGEWSNYYKYRNDWKKAFELYNAALGIKDKITNEKTEQAIANYQSLYQTEKTKLALRTKQSEAKKYRIITIALIVNSAILLLLVFYIIRQSRLRRRLEAEQLRNILSRDLHDEVGSTLSSISMMSQLAQRRGGDAQLMQTISSNSQQMLDSMSDIVWSINPRNDKLSALLSRMRAFAAEALEQKGVAVRFDIPPRLESLSLPMALRRDLYLIFKEAIINIAKYAEAKDVSLAFGLENGLLMMRIEDNGKGFNEEDLKPTLGGNGLRNMRERAAHIGADLIIDARPGSGTHIILRAPLKAAALT